VLKNKPIVQSSTIIYLASLVLVERKGDKTKEEQYRGSKKAAEDSHCIFLRMMRLHCFLSSVVQQRQEVKKVFFSHCFS
jgi:hypothetical protein